MLYVNHRLGLEKRPWDAAEELMPEANISWPLHLFGRAILWQFWLLRASGGPVVICTRNSLEVNS